MLDSSLAQHLTLNPTPDILITPSDLAPFAKIVTLEQPSSSSSSTSAASPSAAPQQPEQAAQACPTPGNASSSSPDGHKSEGATSNAAALLQGTKRIVCINPGRMVRGHHAHLTVGLKPAVTSDTMVEQRTADISDSAARCKVELMKSG